MGLRESKDKRLYQQVSYGNSKRIKKLHSKGAGLEWMDKERKTPLILASMNPKLYDVATTLLELGANANAYRPGRQAGTPLHHAAREGIESMVNLLLSHGANALMMNDDGQTALTVARVMGSRDERYINIVRAIESRICLFSGWLQELYGPGFLEPVVLRSRKVWVTIVPCGARKNVVPSGSELAIYEGLQVAKPRTIIPLSNAYMEKPNFNQPNPTVVITISEESHIKLAPPNKDEKQQLQLFFNVCKGIPQG